MHEIQKSMELEKGKYFLFVTIDSKLEYFKNGSA